MVFAKTWPTINILQDGGKDEPTCDRRRRYDVTIEKLEEATDGDMDSEHFFRVSFLVLSRRFSVIHCD
jgi:hypothetical protein